MNDKHKLELFTRQDMLDDIRYTILNQLDWFDESSQEKAIIMLNATKTYRQTQNEQELFLTREEKQALYKDWIDYTSTIYDLSYKKDTIVIGSDTYNFEIRFVSKKVMLTSLGLKLGPLIYLCRSIIKLDQHIIIELLRRINNMLPEFDFIWSLNKPALYIYNQPKTKELYIYSNYKNVYYIKQISNSITYEFWCTKEGLHKKDGPALIETNNEHITVKKWYTNGILNRDDGPSIYSYDNNGQLITEEWYKLGVLNRIDGPAKTYYYKNGRPRRLEWYKNREKHREDGPAVSEYYENGNIKLEIWYINDYHHRKNGPAYIEYNNDGQVKYEEWYINGIEFKPKQ